MNEHCGLARICWQATATYERMAPEKWLKTAAFARYQPTDRGLPMTTVRSTCWSNASIKVKATGSGLDTGTAGDHPSVRSPGGVCKRVLRRCQSRFVVALNGRRQDAHREPQRRERERQTGMVP